MQKRGNRGVKKREKGELCDGELMLEYQSDLEGKVTSVRSLGQDRCCPLSPLSLLLGGEERCR